jgi:DNA-binding GntR family transcriptional regulator
LDAQDIAEVDAIRVSLETPAARMAGEQATEAHIAEVRSAL